MSTATIPANDPLLLTSRQAAAKLAISPRKLFEIQASGELMSLKIGRLRRFAIEDLQEYIKRCKS